MKSASAKQLNLPIRELLRTEGRPDAMSFRARWQTAVETVSAHALQKLRLELAHSVSELLLTSTHRSNNNGRNLNLLRSCHLPVSA
jgi:hypothetical protein